MGGAQFARARAWVGGARDCKRMEALTLALFLFACTLSPSRGAVANLVLLPDAVKEVSFVWALRYQAVERSNRSFSFNITRREPSAWMVPRLATTSGLVSGFIYCWLHRIYRGPAPYTGSGSGAKSWIVHMEGGGWCFDEDECVARSKTSLGSSKFWKPTATFSGFLSDNQTENPNFYNWNVAFINYCDGASFTGNVWVKKMSLFIFCVPHRVDNHSHQTKIFNECFNFTYKTEHKTANKLEMQEYMNCLGSSSLLVSEAYMIWLLLILLQSKSGGLERKYNLFQVQWRLHIRCYKWGECYCHTFISSPILSHPPEDWRSCKLTWQLYFMLAWTQPMRSFSLDVRVSYTDVHHCTCILFYLPSHSPQLAAWPHTFTQTMSNPFFPPLWSTVPWRMRGKVSLQSVPVAPSLDN